MEKEPKPLIVKINSEILVHTAINPSVVAQHKNHRFHGVLRTTPITFPCTALFDNAVIGCPRVAQKVIKVDYGWLLLSTIDYFHFSNNPLYYLVNLCLTV